ncbi:hypothetical protein M3649_19290 [Ureibacillus chungkukjangi]|uniref:hypothetical protein n=1 Tax=Ureibacillus chungkukjangi TaxID=1202712 RepID=UPI0020403FA4|nr:hypothetical protein [Ureibacillus chungkukjangi]MCM3390246.1 hypothetical protein [Ureibacillus chungkukjangi]
MDNYKTLGYLLLACKRLCYSKEEARNILSEMLIIMETQTAEEANEGFSWYEKLEEEIENTTGDRVVTIGEIRLAKQKIFAKNPKKTTTLSDSYESEITKANQKLLKIIRSL